MISLKRIAKPILTLTVAVSLVAGLLAGCGTADFFSTKYESRWTVSFHLPADERAGENLSVVRVSSLDGRESYLIRTLPLADYKHILRGEPVKKDGKVEAVKFTIHPNQRLKWLSITTQYGGQKVAVCLDGYFRFFWRIPYRFNDQTCQITVEGPWDPREAELVCEWAPINFEKP